MKPRKNKKIPITKESFNNFVYKFYPNFNFENIEYLNKIKEKYFSNVSQKFLSTFKAEPYLRNILIENGFCKNIPNKISHWNSLGYFELNDIRTESYRYCVNNKKYKNLIYDNDDENFKKFIETNIGPFNFENNDYYLDIKKKMFDGYIFICEIPAKTKILDIIYNGDPPAKSITSIRFWTSRGFSEEYAKKEITKLQRPRSKRCVEYYTSKGYSLEEAKKLVTKNQSKCCRFSKSLKDYWIRLGYSEDVAIKISKDIATKRSVWAAAHWINLGYTEDDAKNKCLEYNPSSPQFKKYHKDLKLYAESLNRASIRAQNRWKRCSYLGKKILAVKEGRVSGRSISKEECLLFDFLIKNINENIIHKAYVVAIPEDSSTSLNTYFYACDGYLKTHEGNVIIIEYDGALYHQNKVDEIRDNDILMIDDNVLGILRISDKFFKDKTKTDDEKLTKISNAIQTIKNTPESRIQL